MAEGEGERTPAGRGAVAWLAAPLRVLASAIGVALALLALAAALVLAISRGWQRERLTRVVEWGAERALGRTLRIGALRGSLFPEIELDSVELGPEPSEPESRTGLSLAHLRIELVPGALPRGELDLALLRVSGLRAEAVMPETRAAEQPARTLRERIEAIALPEAPLPIRLRRVEIDDARITLREGARSAHASASAPAPSGAAQLPSGARYAVEVELAGRDLALPWTARESERGLLRARGRVVAGGLAAPLPETAALDSKAELAGGRLAFESAELHTPRGSAVLEALELKLAGWLEGRGIADVEWSFGELRIASPELDALLRGRGDRDRIETLSVDASIPELTKVAGLATALRNVSGSIALRAKASGAYSSPDLELALEGPLALRESGVSRPGDSQRGWLDLSLASRAVFPLGGLGPELAGSLALRALALPDVAIDALEIQLATRAQDYVLRASARARGRQQLSLDAVLSRAPLGRALASRSLRADALARELAGDARTRLVLALAETDLTSLAPWLPPAARDVTARVRADLALAGDNPTPSLTGALEVRGPALVPHTEIDAVHLALASEPARYAISLRAHSPLRAWLTGGIWLPRARFESLLSAAQSLDLQALARELLADGRSRAELRSADLDVALAERWLPREIRDLAGRTRFELEASGASPEPRYAGWLEIERASLRIPILKRKFEPIAARVELEPGAIALRRFEVGSAGSGASASGRVELDGATPRAAELALAFEHFALSRNRIARADVSGAVTLAGAIDALSLRGELAAEKVRVRVESAEDPALREIRVLAADLDREAPDQIVEGAAPIESWVTRALDAIRVDVALSVPRKTQIRGGGASLEVEGRVAVRREPGAAPVLIGSASAVRGRYVFQRNRFRVRSGTVTFDGTPGVDPLVDAEAVRRVSGTQLIAHLGGRLSAPELRFTSEPPLPQDDVLALLLFGRPTAEIGSGEASGVQGMAASLAAGVAFQELGGDELGSLLPVDTFDIGLGDEEQGASLEVGKYLSDRLFVSVGQSVGRTTGTRARAELSLTPHWSVLTDFSSDASSGADIEWSIEY
jgi:hypothetical protein